MLNQEQQTGAWGRIKDFISTRNADITYEEQWGTRRLAYPIRKGSHQRLWHLRRQRRLKPERQRRPLN
jgi:ribosomal protein S6